MKARLLAVGAAAVLALTACGGSTDSSSGTDSAGDDSASSEAASEPPRNPASNPLITPTASPSTMKEVGERLGVDLVKRGFIIEATKKIGKYPDNKAGQAALTKAAARACVAIKDSGGGDAARDAIRTWVEDEGLRGKDGRAVLLVALVSVCPEAEKLLPQD